MIGSLLRPLTTGLQDERIQYDVNPERCKISPYLKVFIRAGRMTTQWVRLDFNQVPDFGRQSTCDLIRKGHFINRLFLVATLPDISTVQQQAQTEAGTDQVYPKFTWVNGIGHTLAAQVQFTISGEIVDQFDSQLLEILDEYYTPLEKVPAVNELIGRNDTNYSPTDYTYSSAQKRVIVPLPFWFSRGDSAAALPIDAIAADQIQVRINFRSLNGTYYTESRSQTDDPCDPSTDGSSLWSLAGQQLYKESSAPGAQAVPGLDPEDPTKTYLPMSYSMPTVQNLHLSDTYLLAEYIYVDKPEANRFRMADIKVPVTQHYILEPYDNQSQAYVNIPIRVPNPCRALFFMAQRYENPIYNLHFLATRDLTAPNNQAIWWPNSQGLQSAAVPSKFIPAFALRDSEPLVGVTLAYEGSLPRYATTAPALFRSVLNGSLFTKTPWVNRYYYALPFGIFPGVKPLTIHAGEANLDKLKKTELRLQFSSQRGCLQPMTVDRYIVRVYAETYNIFRVYGGRASLLFSY